MPPSDSERLDWLERMMAPSMYERIDLISNYLTDDPEDAYALALGGLDAARCPQEFRGYRGTLREAIDVAMQAEEDGGE